MQCLSMAWNICQVWQCDVRAEETSYTGHCEPWCQESGQLDSYYVTQGSQEERLHLLATTVSVMAVITEEMRDDCLLHATSTWLSYAQIQSQKSLRTKGEFIFRNLGSFHLTLQNLLLAIFKTRLPVTLHSFTVPVIYLQNHWVCDLESPVTRSRYVQSISLDADISNTDDFPFAVIISSFMRLMAPLSKHPHPERKLDVHCLCKFLWYVQILLFSSKR